MLPHLAKETGNLRWGDYPGFSRYNHRVLIRGRQEVQSQREDEMMEAEVRERLEDDTQLTLKMEEEATNQESRWPVEAKKRQGMDFP